MVPQFVLIECIRASGVVGEVSIILIYNILSMLVAVIPTQKANLVLTLP